MFLPYEGVAFVWENPDLHDLTKRPEGLLHGVLCKQRVRAPVLEAASRWRPGGLTVRAAGFLPVRPVVTPPQYTVQLLRLDWFTTSSNDRCLVLAAKRKQSRVKKLKEPLAFTVADVTRFLRSTSIQ